MRTMLRATCSGQLHRVGGATFAAAISYPVKPVASTRRPWQEVMQ